MPNIHVHVYGRYMYLLLYQLLFCMENLKDTRRWPGAREQEWQEILANSTRDGGVSCMPLEALYS